ncbi:MAG: MBL fold metallo-hydrolase [Anaerolineae bacterium]|nr:MBL fold metallo-hydrolase [Anaerolineae bacterium]
MQRERVADDIYIFTSDLYAQVTAGVVLTAEGAVLIDTLLFPEETRAIKHFVEGRLACPVRYVINTHYHADHTYGTYMFPDATVISHALCYDLLNTRGRDGLEQARQEMSELKSVQLALPMLVFNHRPLILRLGNKTLHMWHTPGHSPDCSVVLVKEDRVLFGADTLMPIPYFVDGSYDDFLASLQSLQNNTFECIVQGHGEVILRGEIEEKIQSDIKYLTLLKKYATNAHTKSDPEAYLARVDVERCGKSRILLSGQVQQLHVANLRMMYKQVGGNIQAPEPTAENSGDK